jgi:hypothetical protein
VEGLAVGGVVGILLGEDDGDFVGLSVTLLKVTVGSAVGDFDGF